ncbi:hypothetical protein PORY_001365 [Pneumocystis oryctolagi]|uniref:Uncharacterized protein n=1 Tax=Pneumocystis oryctolagi TaxID=42067 RepID=A0ACB7CCI2_9ASCO|nr:hypothetical protein PORY_001365 [Pneumocystis oryctolagi]
MLKLLVDKHIEYILSFSNKLIEYSEDECRKLQNINWVSNALFVLGRKDLIPRKEVIDFVMSCKYEDDTIEAFGQIPFSDPHLLNTLYAVQILTLCDSIDKVNPDKIAKFLDVSSLQDPETGAFRGYFWNEIDARFVYGAVCCLSIIDRLDTINCEKVVEWILKCQNYDGGFGEIPGSESHAGHVLSCIATLSLLKRLDAIDVNLVSSWLSERQVLSGGLNGRPEKIEDVCYSWWVFSPLVMMNRSLWIDNERLINYILSCQEEKDFEKGGISERQNGFPDLFHTSVGIISLSILKYPGLLEMSPDYFLPLEVVQKLNMNKNS